MNNQWKQLFPALADSNTTYLDSASSCQLPSVVIDSITSYLQQGHGNPHRGMYSFSENAEQILSNCRQQIARFINAQIEQIIFTKGTTESINLVANSFRNRMTSAHSILVTELEHHANLLPWQQLCEQTGARLNYLPINSNGELVLEQLESYLADNCALFAFSHASNILGNLTPAKRLIQIAKKYHVPTLVDGAQCIAHHSVDITDLGCDYYAFSGHKIYAPSGIGALYALDPETLHPLLLGGGIVSKVTNNDYQLSPHITRFEAGSANMIGLVGLDAALKFLEPIEWLKIHAHEKQLINQIKQQLDQNIFKIISHPESSHLISIVSPNFHSHDIATVLANSRIAVRAGHHCAQPCLAALKAKHCVRISLGLYNDEADIHRLIEGLNKVPDYLN
ncbi:aminotransferase class V-fold PLP-dependent enzyme [Aliikangiella sp. IMCC44359]|uniref:aminotransferase class V-fold PLP-dependent enzyme n=1 Tax=Aliikangiella sp. IMCC44359 TaxID=3459125 RepID=UPI00403ADDC9